MFTFHITVWHGINDWGVLKCHVEWRSHQLFPMAKHANHECKRSWNKQGKQTPRSWRVGSMVESFKSLHTQTSLLYKQIPVDLYKIFLTQIIQAFGALAITVTLQWEGGGCTLFGGDKSHLSAIKNLETVYGHSHCSMVYMNFQDLCSDSLTWLAQKSRRK